MEGIHSLLSGLTRIVALFSLASLLFVVSTAFAGQVTLSWDPNKEPHVAGYRIHVGNASRGYTRSVDVGDRTTATVGGLRDGRTYYFAVTAYGVQGNESAYSNEVSFTFVQSLETGSDPCRLGGDAVSSQVLGTVDTAGCPVLRLLLTQEPPFAVNGRLYVTLRLSSFPEWSHFMFCRASDDRVPLSNASYVKLIRTGEGFVSDAEDFHYLRGALGGPSLIFHIATEELKGHNIVFETYFVEEGEGFNDGSLRLIQRVDVQFE